MNSNKIALFVGLDAIGLEIINQIVPRLVENELEPVFYNICSEKNREFKVSPLPDLGFYDETLLEEVIYPFIEKYNPDADLKSYEQLSDKFNIEHYKVTDINSVTFNDKLVGAISIRFRQIFDTDTISDIYRKSGFFWNLHGGLLPKYRGILAAYWAKVNGENEYGWSLHNIAKNGKIDAGKIISSKTIPFVTTQSLRKLYVDMIPHGAEMILESISDILSGTLIPQIVQKEENARYYPSPTEEQINKEGLVYCSPKEALEYYVSRYGGYNIHNREYLRNMLIQRILEHEQSKVSPFEFDTSLKFG